jgi:hypothetical protein
VIIIVDLNGVIFSTILPNIMSGKTNEIDEDLVRHIVLSIIRSVNSKFRKDWGELVLANDNRRYWRKEVFPYYKASRKKSREAMGIDWPVFFTYVEKIKGEIQTNLPYKYIEVERAEADDVIATLVRNVEEPCLIVSSDKDMIQLHCERVKQYDLIKKKWITHDDPKAYLFEHIVKGDVGDGIPNIVSTDNVFVLGQRQGRVTQGVLESCRNVEMDPSHRLYRNWLRNKTLVDLTQIPQDIQDAILHKYREAKKPSRSNMMMYFASHDLQQLMAKINDF